MSIRKFSVSALFIGSLLASTASLTGTQVAWAQDSGDQNNAQATQVTQAAASHTDSGDQPTAAQPTKDVSLPTSAKPATTGSAASEEGSAAAQGQHHPDASPGPGLNAGADSAGNAATKSTGAPAAADNSGAATQAPVGGAGTVGQSVPSSGNGQPAGASTGTAPNGVSANAVAGSGATSAHSAPTQSPSTGAAPPSTELVHQTWPFDGLFGTYDRAALQRGFQVYKQVCSACHSLNLLSYRNLEDLGYTEGQVKAIAQDYQVTDGPNDEGEMFQRPAKPSDRFHAPFANKKAAQAANNGAAPPDMSLLAKAREGGPDYIYGILTGYADPPAGFAIQPGQYYNKTMPGHIIAMPPPLHDGAVTYENATGIPNTTEQYARDVASFLQWASEPHQDERKRTGLKAIIFLGIFTIVLGLAKKKIWRKVH